jgi:hypothetical protein
MGTEEALRSTTSNRHAPQDTQYPSNSPFPAQPVLQVPLLVLVCKASIGTHLVKDAWPSQLVDSADPHPVKAGQGCKLD